MIYPGGYVTILSMNEKWVEMAKKERRTIGVKSSSAKIEHEESIAITNRLKRAHGQLGAVVRMLEEGRDCEDIVTQIAAVSKAINTAAFTLISSSLKECIQANTNNSTEITEKLQKLFLSLA